ncbi:uncharacterized protein TNCV_2420681 [Trichonephila clavipes]|uniref:Uncharacterized protein n=1 Tax=Trichonephila clavipes TaxID=2585209 RepID=A0A8X6RDC6_TRICX|nr:uncharacterized protein TNCV_2420681 [Trichonephila clavipes]
MPTMDRKTFAKCMHNLSVKNKEVKKKMLEMSRQAAREAHVKVDASLKNQEIIDVSVSYDVAGRDMGVDSAEFHIWQKGHADECDKNFDGTSGAMEMHAALIMWRRSISDCQMRFVSMLSDGTSLRNKVKEWKVKKVTLGGRKQGSLTDKNITKLQNYYRTAVKDNVPDTDKMKTAIYASLMHCSSADKKPMHASDTILERCVAGKPQNSNESMRSCIWRKCPKEVFVSKRRLEIAVTDAIEKHNLGYGNSLEAKEDSCLNDSFS